MNYEGLKIYGVCLQRLEYQIKIARSKIERENLHNNGKVMLECYQTGEIDEIIDLLELYDIEDKRPETIREKLEELAENLSLMIRETIDFGFSDEGLLCLYLRLNEHK